jgi:hypothetical protein
MRKYIRCPPIGPRRLTFLWFHRSITRPFFSRERIGDFDVFESHATDAVSQAINRLLAGYHIDFQVSLLSIQSFRHPLKIFDVRQDLVSKFTSATEFLFGKDVHSLAAGLPYPASSPLANSPGFLNHPSNIFVDAFVAGLHLTALCTRYGRAWPLIEFWEDIVKPHRDIVDQYIDPIRAEHIAREVDGKAPVSGIEAISPV